MDARFHGPQSAASALQVVVCPYSADALAHRPLRAPDQRSGWLPLAEAKQAPPACFPRAARTERITGRSTVRAGMPVGVTELVSVVGVTKRRPGFASRPAPPAKLVSLQASWAVCRLVRRRSPHVEWPGDTALPVPISAIASPTTTEISAGVNVGHSSGIGGLMKSGT